MNFENAYKKLRAGKIFLVGLCLFCTFWVGWNLTPGLPHFDDLSFGHLTLILSIEASVAMGFMTAAQEKQDADNLRRDLYLLHMMEVVFASHSKPGALDRQNIAPACAGIPGENAEA